jgi:hypothetical protein
MNHMLKNLSRGQMAGLWCAAIVAIGAASVAAGASTTSGAVELWLAACLVPPAVMLLVWRGAPPVTVAELLHDVNQPGKAGPK